MSSASSQIRFINLKKTSGSMVVCDAVRIVEPCEQDADGFFFIDRLFDGGAGQFSFPGAGRRGVPGIRPEHKKGAGLELQD